MTKAARPLLIASVGGFTSALSTSLVAVSVPVIAREMRVTASEVSAVLSAYLLVISCLLALAGRAADLLGRRRVYLTGFAAFVAGSLACAASPSLGALVGARVLQGVGASMLMAVGPAIVTRAVPPAQRARGLGVLLAATYLGLTVGPGLGGLLSARVTWQAVFVAIAASGIGGALVAARLLPEGADEEAARGAGGAEPRAGRVDLDLGGAALFAAGMAALLLALQRTRGGWTSAPPLGLFAAAAVALLLFARHEGRREAPLLPLGLLRTHAFAFGVAGATLLYAVTMMLSYALSFELQHGAGLSAASAGAFMTAQPAAMAVVAPMSGAIADRRGPRWPSALGMVAIAAGLACVAVTAPALPRLVPPAGAGPAYGRALSLGTAAPLVLSLALVGVGAGLYVAPNSAVIMSAAPRDRQATAGAMAATARNVGMTLGIALAASLGPALGFQRTLFVAAALAAFGAVLGLVRPVA